MHSILPLFTGLAKYFVSICCIPHPFCCLSCWCVRTFWMPPCAFWCLWFLSLSFLFGLLICLACCLSSGGSRTGSWSGSYPKFRRRVCRGRFEKLICDFSRPVAKINFQSCRATRGEQIAELKKIRYPAGNLAFGWGKIGIVGGGGGGSGEYDPSPGSATIGFLTFSHVMCHLLFVWCLLQFYFDTGVLCKRKDDRINSRWGDCYF